MHILWIKNLKLKLELFANNNNNNNNHYYYYHYFQSFWRKFSLMVFHWSLSDCKSTQVSTTLLSILAVLNNVVWMVSTRPPTSKSSSPFNNLLVTVPKAPITICIIVTFLFHSFCQLPSKVEVLILLFIFFPFYFEVSRVRKVNNLALLLLLLLL